MRFLRLLTLLFTFSGLTAQTITSISRENPNYHSDIVYAGLSNVLRVEMPDGALNDLQIFPSYGTIRPDSVPGQFIWNICHLDSAHATLTLRKRGQRVGSVAFKVKMIPPPKFIFSRGGCRAINGALVLTVPGIGAAVENFPFLVPCHMIRFTAIYLPKDQDPIEKINRGGRFSGEVDDLVKRAKPGDRYTYRDFRYQCGCDATIRRSIEVLNFEIK